MPRGVKRPRVCVYTGLPWDEIAVHDGGLILRSELPGAGAVTTAWSNRDTLVKAFAIPAPGALPAPLALADFRLVCPCTGELIEVRRMGSSDPWAARVTLPDGLGYWTDGYGYKEELLWFLGHRFGVAPAWPRRQSLQVRDVAPPAPDPFADMRAQDKEIDHAVAAFIDDVRAGVAGGGSPRG